MATFEHIPSSRWDSQSTFLPEILDQDDVEIATAKLRVLAESTREAQNKLACLRMERFFSQYPWAIAAFDVEHADGFAGQACSRLTCYVSPNPASKMAVPLPGMALGEDLARSLRAIGDFRFALQGQHFDALVSFSAALLGQRQSREWHARRERAQIAQEAPLNDLPNAKSPRI